MFLVIASQICWLMQILQSLPSSQKTLEIRFEPKNLMVDCERSRPSFGEWRVYRFPIACRKPISRSRPQHSVDKRRPSQIRSSDLSSGLFGFQAHSSLEFLTYAEIHFLFDIPQVQANLQFRSNQVGLVKLRHRFYCLILSG